jgi:hypothetical protein
VVHSARDDDGVPPTNALGAPAFAAAAAREARIVSASITRGLTVRYASGPPPRAVSSGRSPADVFGPGATDPNAPLACLEDHDRAVASHACLRGDVVDSGDSNEPAPRGPVGVRSNVDAFTTGASAPRSSGLVDAMVGPRRARRREFQTPRT